MQVPLTTSGKCIRYKLTMKIREGSSGASARVEKVDSAKCRILNLTTAPILVYPINTFRQSCIANVVDVSKVIGWGIIPLAILNEY